MTASTFLFIYIVGLIGGLINLGLAVYSWTQWHRGRIYVYYTGIMVGISIWVLSFVGYSFVQGLENTVFVANFQYFGIVLLVFCWLYFAFEYTGRSYWISRRLTILLTIEPVLVLILLWTDSYHGLIRSSVWLEQIDGFDIFMNTTGPFFWIHTAYSYILLLFGLILLIQTWISQRDMFRTQAFILIFGALAPWFSNLISILGYSVIDLTAVSFTITGIALGWGLFQYKLLNVRPIAHSVIMESISNAILVLDADDNLVEFNQSAKTILPTINDKSVGIPASEVFGNFPELFEQFRSTTSITTDIEVNNVIFQLRITPLSSDRNLGRVIVLEDVTELKKALSRTESLFQVARAAAEYTNLDSLLQIVADTVATFIPANRVSIVLIDTNRKVTTNFVRGGIGKEHINTRVTYEELMQGLTGHALQTGRYVFSPKNTMDARESPDVQQRRQDTQAGSVVVVPLKVKTEFLGTLTAINLPEDPDFTNEDVILISSMANQVSIAVQNARLFEEQLVINQELQAYSSTVAHDLKNPVAAVMGYSEMLEMLLTDREKELELAQRITWLKAPQLSEIIHSLLLLARVRITKIEIRPVEMGKIVAQVMERMQLLIDQSEVAIEIPKEWPVVLGYSPWIGEIWANFISNALKYGGQEIRLGFDELEKGKIQFWVTDNGPGILPEVQGKLFQPFERLGIQDEKGHGLGLSIVMRIIEKLGGEVWVESAPEQGSTFYFTLPLAP